MPQSDIAVIDRVKLDNKEPGLWAVLLLNDDVTPVDFVIEILTRIFRQSHDDAIDITQTVHNEGTGIAGVYIHEIAEAKSNEATAMARDSGYPLRIRIVEA